MRPSVKVTCLGAGDAFGSGGRHQSGYLVETGEKAFLMDCGPTALLALKGLAFDTGKLDFVLLSHLHGDHFSGLPFLFLEYLYENPRRRPFLVAGPPGTEERVWMLYRTMYQETATKKLLFALLFVELFPDRETDIEGVAVFPFRVPHQEREISLAWKIHVGDKSILYSGDSGWTEDFVRYSQGVDLFICECCFYETRVGFHMSYPQIARQRERLGCKRLILSHLGREMLARMRDLPAEFAYDGMVVEV